MRATSGTRAVFGYAIDDLITRFETDTLLHDQIPIGTKHPSL